MSGTCNNSADTFKFKSQPMLTCTRVAKLQAESLGSAHFWAPANLSFASRLDFVQLCTFCSFSRCQDAPSRSNIINRGKSAMSSCASTLSRIHNARNSMLPRFAIHRLPPAVDSRKWKSMSCKWWSLNREAWYPCSWTESSRACPKHHLESKLLSYLVASDADECV